MKNSTEHQYNFRSLFRHCAILIIATFACLFARSAQAQVGVFPLPFYEPFPFSSSPYTYNSVYSNVGYVADEELGQYGFDAEATGSSGTAYVWSWGNSVSGSDPRFSVTGQSGLEYPGLTNIDATYNTGLLTTYIKSTTSSTKNRGVQLHIPTNNLAAPEAIYASFLLQIITNSFTSPVEPAPIFTLCTNTYPATSINSQGAVVYLSNSFQLMISKSAPQLSPAAPATNTTAPISTNNVHLIVLRYQYTGPGSNDSVDLWVDPIALGNNAAIPAPTISTTNGANVSSNFFGGAAILEYADGPLINIDEIRVDTSWAGVTPSNYWGGHIYSVTGGGSGCGAESFPVGLTGSDTGVTYMLYTNGIFTGITANGTGSSFNFVPNQSTSAIYTVVGSNNTAMPSIASTWMRGSASITVDTTAAISSQPVALTVPSGELGVFTVGATGGGLTYQWYKNGQQLSDQNEFSGTHTATLVINPVTSQDVEPAANGYYVVVNNPCGTPATSSKVALSLGTPNNLTWDGGLSSSWDVNTTANWNSDTRTFNYGDNVTFDNTAPNMNVTLANNYLSPSSITVSGGPYTFSSMGLAGSGTMTVTGTGNLTLALGMQNNETGAVTINSGGVLTIANGANLGSGTVNIDGGQLIGGNFGAIFVHNPIVINGAGSVIGVSSVGGQAVNLTNTLTGTSGDLTFLDNAAATANPAIILEGPNFTFGLPVNLNVGNQGGGLVVEGGNTNGVQEWQNVISGGGEIQRNGAGGETLLDAANTFTGGVVLTAGALGVANAGALGSGPLIVDTAAGGTPDILASGAAHTVPNAIVWSNSNIGGPFTISGSYPLTFTGNVDMTGTNRIIQASNSAAAIFKGALSDDSGQGIDFTGTGSIYLDGANSYTGTTTNDAALLAGTGSIAGPVRVNADGTLGGGDNSGIGTLTINNNLSLVGGNLSIRVNTSAGQKNDTISVSGTLNNSGSGNITVNNLGPALTVGQTFTIFNKAVPGGGTMTISGGGVSSWQNLLAQSGSIKVASLAPPPSPKITTATSSVSGGTTYINFSGNNGTTGTTYYILTSTDLSAALSSWTEVASGTFGAGGTFSASIAVNPSTPQRYYVVALQP